MMSKAVRNPRIQFGVRPCDDPAGAGRFYCEIIAVTPTALCYRLLHAECDEDEDDPVRRPAIRRIEDVTLAYALHMWKECRHHWLPDELGGAGVKIVLNHGPGAVPFSPCASFANDPSMGTFGLCPEDRCPFCDVASKRILECNALVLAIADAYPVSAGHTLIVPRRHVVDFFELTVEEIRSVYRMLRVMRYRLHRTMAPAGYNIGVNVAPTAGQTISHTHIHLIPRYPGDVPDPAGGVRNVIPGKGRYG